MRGRDGVNKPNQVLLRAPAARTFQPHSMVWVPPRVLPHSPARGDASSPVRPATPGTSTCELPARRSSAARAAFRRPTFSGGNTFCRPRPTITCLGPGRPPVTVRAERRRGCGLGPTPADHVHHRTRGSSRNASAARCRIRGAEMGGRGVWGRAGLWGLVKGPSWGYSAGAAQARTPRFRGGGRWAGRSAAWRCPPVWTVATRASVRRPSERTTTTGSSRQKLWPARLLVKRLKGVGKG